MDGLSDTAPPVETGSPAPASQPERQTLTLDEGVALLARARIAQAAPLAPAATDKQPSGAPAPEGQSEAEEAPDTAEEPAPEEAEEEAGETPEDEAKPLIEADPAAVVFIDEAGNPVTVEEAQKGYMRRDDYSRKTEEVARARETLTEHEALIARAAETATQLLPKLVDALEGKVKPIPALPDVSLRSLDPLAYWDQYHAHHDAIRERRELESQAAEVAKAAEIANERARADWLAAERAELLKAIPTWRDPKIAAQEKSEILAYGRELGFSDAELVNVNHRQMVALRDAVVGAKVRKGGGKGGAAPRVLPQPKPSGIGGGDARPAGSLTGASAGDRAALREQARAAPSRHDREAAAAQLLRRPRG